MSKIGRKPIAIKNVSVEIKGNTVSYKGSKSSGTYVLPFGLQVNMDDKNLCLTINKEISVSNKQMRLINREWGLHRALLANQIIGAEKGFENQLEIRGLGYKAAISGNSIVFTLGYSHKIEISIPKGISVEADKSGQKIMIRSSDKELAGQFCSDIKKLRMPDAYKGKGIKRMGEDLILKSVGKSK